MPKLHFPVSHPMRYLHIPALLVLFTSFTFLVCPPVCVASICIGPAYPTATKICIHSGDHSTVPQYHVVSIRTLSARRNGKGSNSICIEYVMKFTQGFWTAVERLSADQDSVTVLTTQPFPCVHLSPTTTTLNTSSEILVANVSASAIFLRD